MKTLKIEFVNDDWVRCYVDGKLICEAHSVDVSEQYEFTQLAAALGFRVETSSVQEEV